MDIISLVARLVAQRAMRPPEPEDPDRLRARIPGGMDPRMGRYLDADAQLGVSPMPAVPSAGGDPDMMREVARGMSLRQQAGTVPFLQTPFGQELMSRIQIRPSQSDTTWPVYPVYSTQLEDTKETRRMPSTTTRMRQIEIPPDQGEPEDTYGTPEERERERQEGPFGPQPWMARGKRF